MILNLKAPLRFPPSTWGSISQAAVKLIKQTCCEEPGCRLSAQQVLENDWVKSGSCEAQNQCSYSTFPISRMLANAEQFGEMSGVQRASLHRVAYYVEDDVILDERKAFL